MEASILALGLTGPTAQPGTFGWLLELAVFWSGITVVGIGGFIGLMYALSWVLGWVERIVLALRR
jgi:hypothetical protein